MHGQQLFLSDDTSSSLAGKHILRLSHALSECILVTAPGKCLNSRHIYYGTDFSAACHKIHAIAFLIWSAASSHGLSATM